MSTSIEKFDSEIVLRVAYGDDDASLDALRNEFGVDDIDSLQLVRDLDMDPSVDGMLLQDTLRKELRKVIPMGKSVRTIVSRKLDEKHQKKYADILSRDEFRDGDQDTVERLFDEAGITRGDVKRALVAIASECTEK